MNKKKWYYFTKYIFIMIATGALLVRSSSVSAEDSDHLKIDGSTLLSYTGEEEVVKIPEGITEIGRGAFGKCESLTRVIIPKSLKSIRDSAFAGCRNLVCVEYEEDIGKASAALTYSMCEPSSNLSSVPKKHRSIG